MGVDNRPGQKHSSIENLVIIGSGPAGYTAAIYSSRANLNPLLVTGFDKGGIPGGQLMTTTFVENFPGFPNGIKGPELMDRMKAQAIRWGTKLIEDDADAIDLKERPFLIKINGEIIKTNSLIIATGARANRLNLPKEEKFWSHGISACAICDGSTPQFRNERLAVVGGGDSACEEAVYLTKYSSEIHLLVRSNTLRASAPMATRVKANPKITIHWETELIGIYGNDWLEELQIRSKDSNQIENLSVKGLFYAIGHTPNTEIIAGQLDTDSHGYLLTNSGRPETSIEGVYAAGDVCDSEWKQGITASSSGCKAALAAERWLNANNLIILNEQLSEIPKEVSTQTDTKISSEANYNSKAVWQKGSYALRKLYHESSKPLLVIYTSNNCGPCYVLKPQIKRVLKELNGEAQGVEIDIETDQDIAKQANITGTPSVQLFQQKKLKAQWKGVKQRNEFKQAIEKLL